MSQPSKGKPTPAPGTAPGTGSKPTESDDLVIESAEWPSTTTERPPHPVLTARLQESWSGRKDISGRTVCPPLKLTAKDSEDATLRERQIRHAAGTLGIGVSVKRTDRADGKVDVLFRARPKKRTGKSDA